MPNSPTSHFIISNMSAAWPTLLFISLVPGLTSGERPDGTCNVVHEEGIINDEVGAVIEDNL